MIKVETIDIGDSVVCDLCSHDFTDSDAKGGYLFMSKGVCPNCAPSFEASVRKYGEEKYIETRANPDESFRDFVLRIRGDDHYIRITTID